MKQLKTRQPYRRVRKIGLVILFFGVPISTVSCDMFVAYGGEEGQPCVWDGDACERGLVCNYDTCVPPLQEDEQCEHAIWYGETICEADLWCVDNRCVSAGAVDQPCRGSTARYDNSQYCNDGLTCVDDLCVPGGTEGLPCYDSQWNPCEDETFRCIDDICVAPPDATVLHPQTQIPWQRCAVGEVWEGWHCSGSGIYFLDETRDDLCPEGTVVPSAGDFLTLFDNCDQNASLFVDGSRCMGCPNAEPCSEMFALDMLVGNFLTSSIDEFTEQPIVIRIDNANATFSRLTAEDDLFEVICIQ